jgi:hypothetical protein
MGIGRGRVGSWEGSFFACPVVASRAPAREAFLELFAPGKVVMKPR